MKIYNARAQLLFCSLKLLFSDVPVAVAIGAFLNSLLFDTECPLVVFQTVADCVEHYYMTKPFGFDFEKVSRTLTWRLGARNG